MSSRDPQPTRTLRLTQTRVGADTFRVEIAVEGAGVARRTAESTFTFTLTAQEREDVRWYLEDYLQFPADPAPEIAARIERHTDDIGRDLFGKAFDSSRDAQRVWDQMLDAMNQTRVEIVTTVEDAAAIPWELLRDPQTDHALALFAQSFVRTQPNAALNPRVPQSEGTIRILLAICRPGRDDDVPFRSVASRIVKGLGDRDDFDLHVLRPATFKRLGEALREAKQRGAPYHVVHFDGHGVYGSKAAFKRDVFSDNRPGDHGYLAFENPGQKANMELVSGPKLGKLLAETGVPVLVLNACRSAHAEPSATPKPADGDVSAAAPAASAPADPHAQVRAYGSLAQEVMDAGAGGVLAMRYNVFVVTAAQFVADLYTALASGLTFGHAATDARKGLAEKPLREISVPRELQDWPVPIVYEAAPIRLFPPRGAADILRVDLNAGQVTPGARLDADLPRPPDAGFFGRDDALLDLDRAFDSQCVVLLHAYAGSGKTATAAEFARWYALTGGLRGEVTLPNRLGEGVVLFTSFERRRTLADLLAQLAVTFEQVLQAKCIPWDAKSPAEKRNIALQILRDVPVLWVWDNVEPVAGFPSGAASAWSGEEQRELADFLRDARDTRARFLLTSRRDERGWLGDVPRRITLRPMRWQERSLLARALAERHGRPIVDVDAWQPLLRYSQGNPLTLTVVVGQALRDGLNSKDQIEAYVARLRAGEAAFTDEAEQGRAKSLGASLGYGFDAAFGEDERRVLALLHLFQGFVDVNTLVLMGDPGLPAPAPEVAGLIRETAIRLLDRAAEIGLLNAYGGGYYAIHPTVPWFLQNLFERYYGSPSSIPPTPFLPPPVGEEGGAEQSEAGDREGLPPALRAVRAWVEAEGALGDYYHNAYGAGNRGVIAALAEEEDNLLRARALARRYGWWGGVISAMQGLDRLYDHRGRREEWRRLVEEIVPDFVDAATGGPRPGREEEWRPVMEYRVRLAQEARRWQEAEALQRVTVEWDRRRAADALAAPPASLDDRQRHTVRSLAVTLHELAQIEREQGQSACVAHYEEALALLERIADKPAAASAAFNLGHAYKDLPALRDLAQAETWYRRSLALTPEDDRLGRGQCLGQLGLVARERFAEARAAGRPAQEQRTHFNAALRSYLDALAMFPADDVADLAVTHHQIGIIYGDAGDLDQALPHYRESIRYKESMGDLYLAGTTRYNVALALAQDGRLGDALLYAQAALRNFEPYGAGAADMAQKTQELIALIEEAGKTGNG
ncbi:MAG: CHAT domain-containing protein [Anaerolineae bacterium]